MKQWVVLSSTYQVLELSRVTIVFKDFRTISTFVRDNYNCKIISEETDEDQSSLSVENMIFKKKTKPQNPEKKQGKRDILNSLYVLFEGRGIVLDAFESKITSMS